MRSQASPGLWQRLFLYRWIWPLFLLLFSVVVLPNYRMGRWDSACLDLAFELRLRFGLAEPMPREILLLEVDDNDLIGLATVASEYEAIARAIRQASELGARVIAIDALFQRGGPAESQPILDAIEETRRNGTTVVLAEVWDPYPADAVPDSRHSEFVRSFPFHDDPYRPAGLANANPDGDGVFRRYQLVWIADDETRSSLALGAHLAGLPPGIPPTSPTPGVIQWAELAEDFVTQIDYRVDDEEFWLNYNEPWASNRLDRTLDPPMRRHWNLRDLGEYVKSLAAPPREGEEPLAAKPFAGKTIIFGYVAEGAADRGPTPFGAREPKLMVHAQALSDYLTGQQLRAAILPVSLSFACFPFLFCLTAPIRRHSWLGAIFGIGLILLFVAAFLLFVFAHRLVPIVFLSLVWSAGFAFELIRRVNRESLGRSALLASVAASKDDGAAEGTLQFWSFLSYSSRDRKFVSRFHRALERYRVPVWLVGKTGEHGTAVPPRVFPVFRDRDELRGSPDLAAQLEGALEQSRTLVVVCSTSSAESIWVNEEVLRFKRMGRGNRIVCVIPDNETVDPPDCFCDALRHRLKDNGELDDAFIEPLAADARRWRDGFNNAKLKVIAGVLGISFDDLRQRELQRKERRLTLGAIAAAAVLLLAIFATVRLSREREAAEERRDRAEAVIERIERDLENLGPAAEAPDEIRESLGRIQRYRSEMQSKGTLLR